LLGAGRWHIKGTKVVYATNSEPLLFGSHWLRKNQFVELLVPSVLISGRDGSLNCIINPAHPEIGTVVFSGPEIVAFDPRFGV